MVCTAVFLLISAAWSHASENIDAIPKLGSLKNYKDWVVGCDNVKICQAVSLQDDFRAENAPHVVITRMVGLKPMTEIEIYNLTQISDRYKIIIDGKIADTGVINPDNESITVAGQDAEKLALAIVRGYKMQIFDGLERSLGRVSLSGSSAAVRYMDDVQSTAGTVAALAVKGDRGYDGKAISIPKIKVRKITEAAAIPEVSDILQLSRVSGCDEQQFGVSEDRAYSLGIRDGKAVALVAISCGSGAYNFSAAPYIGTQSEGKWSFSPALFDYDGAVYNSDNGAKVLVNLSWEEDKQVLSSFNKGRGIADCGDSAEYIWDGDTFRLISAQSMDPCRGARQWVSLWKALPIYDDINGANEGP